MSNPIRINAKSDFIIRERFTDSLGNPAPIPPDVDFSLRYSSRHGSEFRAGRIAGVYSNCRPDPEDPAALFVVFKDHALCEGTLSRELHLALVNDLFPGGVQNSYSLQPLAVELWPYASPSDPCVSSDVVAAYTRGLPFTFDDFTPSQLASLKGDKGDPFTFEDFTPGQIGLLQAPALQAATRADRAAADAVNATDTINARARQWAEDTASALSRCNSATSAANTARQAADIAAGAASSAAVSASSEREGLLALRDLLIDVAARAEAAAAPLPALLRVSAPRVITLRNPVPQFIRASLLPASSLQNIIYLSGGPAARVRPDGRIIPIAPGRFSVDVIPPMATRLFQSVDVDVVPPRLRLSSSGALRLTPSGAFRLT